MYINIEKVSKFSINCLETVGVPYKEAIIITDVMLQANMQGIHSHGILRLPLYVDRIQKGLMKNRLEVTYESENESLILINGNNSAGPVVANHAMRKSINKAKETGVGISVVKKSNHFGISAYYSMMAAKKGMIGIVMSNTAPLMPAIGGAERIIGNNPISISSPTKSSSIVLDMALSNAAFGQILFAKEKGDQISEEWATNAEGVPTSNPDDVINGGFLLPVGGPKGFGLAFMAELLTGVLSGGTFSKLIPSLYDMEKKQSISHFMLSIDIEKLLPLELYYKHLDELVSFVKQSQKAPGVNEVFLPGEIESREAKLNEKRGVPIHPEIIKSLNQLAARLELTRLTN